MASTVDILLILHRIFAEQLDKPGIKLTVADNGETLPDWDSLAHVRIMAAVESHYGFQFDLEELEQLKSVGEIVEAVKGRV